MSLLDTNSDGGRDLVVLCTGNGTVTVYLGHEDGVFIPWQCARPECRRPPLASGTAPSGLVTGRFDLTGGADLAVVNQFSDTLTLYLSRDVPLDGVRVTVADIDRQHVFPVTYLNVDSRPTLGTATDASGRFMALNVDPGNVWAASVDGDNGNRRYVVFPDQVSYGDLRVVADSVNTTVVLQGQVNDAVGSPQANIEVNLAGSGVEVITSEALSANGVYEMTVPANQNVSVMRLRKPVLP